MNTLIWKTSMVNSKILFHIVKFNILKNNGLLLIWKKYILLYFNKEIRIGRGNKQPCYINSTKAIIQCYNPFWWHLVMHITFYQPNTSYQKLISSWRRFVTLISMHYIISTTCQLVHKLAKAAIYSVIQRILLQRIKK